MFTIFIIYKNDIDYYSTKESEKQANRKAIAEAIKEKNNLLTLKNNILYVKEQKTRDF